MNRLTFTLARVLRRDEALMRLSVVQAALMSELAGKSVALVGNARALSNRTEGARIDAADIVIRINRAPMPAPHTHGSRCDWLALATAIGPGDLARIAPNRILWMSHKRKRLPWAAATSHGFYLHPVAEFTRLRSQLSAPPTTGLMMIDLLAQSGLARLDLFGFDFFASLSLTGSRTAGQVPHDFGAERGFVEALIAHDPRITLIGG
ncbi:MAG: glycosyltransferase family 29 protein [Albidovulum sp.]